MENFLFHFLFIGVIYLVFAQYLKLMLIIYAPEVGSNNTTAKNKWINDTKNVRILSLILAAIAFAICGFIVIS